MTIQQTPPELGVLIINMSDEELVQLTLDGDTTAFDVLAERYRTAFTRVAWNLVKNDTEAQDVVQTAFYNMFRKLYTFKPGSNFRSWAFRVVTNTGLMRLRKKRNRPEVDLEKVNPTYLSDHQPPSISIAPTWSVRADRAVENKEMMKMIEKAVEELPEKYREVFVLREMEELSLKEIGERMDLSIPAVKSRLHRSRQYLRASLEPYLTGRM